MYYLSYDLYKTARAGSGGALEFGAAKQNGCFHLGILFIYLFVFMIRGYQETELYVSSDMLIALVGLRPSLSV